MSKIACILVGVLVLVSLASALQFPEVVGKKGEAAKKFILSKFPDLRVKIISFLKNAVYYFNKFEFSVCQSNVKHMKSVHSNRVRSDQIFILKDGSPVTMDYRPDRVRIFVDDDGFVVGTPYSG
ncbi:hypothetical protein HELRODRAFT_165183 [Helobdella robusta]|uniref:Uncharacterized protein n=1 Tax=Helobdella robusta TaxID=6412 RepID=T1EWE3_HELRO|nr:hypothetical protein HELRODRAFT_165183 [Helobdella robusta]ESN93027.1 hypothetical protein HELRODRAFT_165183 [Helobdella robusta]